MTLVPFPGSGADKLHGHAGQSADIVLGIPAATPTAVPGGVLVPESVQLGGDVHRPQQGHSVLPKSPQSLDDTGLPASFLAELLAKVMAQMGMNKLADLSAYLCLPLHVVEVICQNLRRDGLLEIARRGQADPDVTFELTMTGRARAGEWLARSQYTGPAPVPLAAYVERVRAQSSAHREIHEADVRKAFEGLVVPEELVERLGVAMNSLRPMLLWGPAGSGKTYLAEHLARLLGGRIAIPHAVLVHGEVIRIFDAHWHHQAPAARSAAQSLDARARPDARWVLCDRPVVVAGGELTLEMLDLQFDPRAGFYDAPPHVKANNGIFIVDDLGRQIVKPQELMNRWIVPMERRYDYLVLRTGGKFMVPFDLNLVFATNLHPRDLADEAFLRRLGHKIGMGPMNEEDYLRVFEQACLQARVPFSREAFEGLLADLHRKEGRPLMACYPRDLLHLILGRSAFRGERPVLSADTLDWAWNAYFAGSLAKEDRGR